MKQFFKTHVNMICAVMLFLGCLLCTNQVNAKSYQVPDNYYGGSCSVVISKDKVYYSVTETGKIFCYNIKTKKTKTIAKAKGKGFYRLRKKGNYLYAVYDKYFGSDGSDDTIVRVSIKNGKKTTLAKGNNFVIAGKKIYYTKTKRVKSKYESYDKPLGTYSMTLTGKKKKRAKSVVLNPERDEKSVITTSKGSLFTQGYTRRGFYHSQSLNFTAPDGVSTVIYDITSDPNASDYAALYYYTLQGNYVVYKKYVKDKKYGTAGQLVLVKTDGTDARVIYSNASVSGW